MELEVPALSVVVMPRVYELPQALWKWCKIGEVCEIIPDLAKLAKIEGGFKPTPEELVRNFAALVRLNKEPEVASEDGKELPNKKFFRYSLTGCGFSSKEVPTGERTMPPYTPFNLDIDAPYPRDMFVPAGWVIDTLKAIRTGAVAAVDFGDIRLGFPPRNSRASGIFLERSSKAKSGGDALVRRPSTV